MKQLQHLVDEDVFTTMQASLLTYSITHFQQQHSALIAATADRTTRCFAPCPDTTTESLQGGEGGAPGPRPHRLQGQGRQEPQGQRPRRRGETCLMSDGQTGDRREGLVLRRLDFQDRREWGSLGEARDTDGLHPPPPVPRLIEY